MLTKCIKEYKLCPEQVYKNLHTEQTKKDIFNNTKGLSGVYLIFNNITGDFYIGSAPTNKFYARFCNHLLHFKGSKILKLAAKKYGVSNFSFLILELFNEVVNKENNKNLLDMEDFYLKSLLPNYNILTEAGFSFGYKHTELTRIKIKSYYRLEECKATKYLNLSNNLSEKPIEKIEHKTLNKKKFRLVTLYNFDGTVFGNFTSIVEIANAINCSTKTIKKSFKTKKKILNKRFYIKYS